MSNTTADATLDFTPAEIQLMLDSLDTYTPEEQAEIYKIATILEQRQLATACFNDLIAFCQHMQPDYKVGKHHRILANMLMSIADGREDRVCVNMPPRHGKSQLVSIYFPAWFIGKYPNKKILMVSHTSDLAVDFGRKVRNIIDSAAYKEVFPLVTLASDSKSAGRWNTNMGGEYYATGVGSALAGRGADLLLVDDPHNEQDIINGNFGVFDKAYEWFTYGARTRLMPGGRVAIVQCMTGDTPVLMADGREKPLGGIQVGDVVASFDEGSLTPSVVVNHQSNGIDHTFAITTTCGKVVRANERHPFLVDHNGELRWVRLKHLKLGDTLVALKGAHTHPVPKPNPVCAAHVGLKPHTTAKTRMPRSVQLDTGVSTGGSYVLSRVVQNLRTAMQSALRTTTRIAGLLGLANVPQRRTEVPTSSIGTASHWMSTTRGLLHRAGFALFVSSHPLRATPAHTGTTSSALTTAIVVGRFAHYYATIATSPQGTQKLRSQPSLSQSTCDFTGTQIASIEYVGEVEVFDIQVERTENFIANGLVSHNTRWHLDDLTGKVTKDMQNPDADQYHVVEFPAIMEVKDKKTGALIEKPLWPEFYDLKALLRTKASMPVFQWNAQYQQNPTSEEASVVKREWWQVWKKDEPPPCEYVIMSLDSAAETNNRSDYTAITTWGVFFYEETKAYNIILLNAIKKRVEFPELKKLALAEYKEWEPDAFIVEKKSSGVALYQELRRTEMQIQEYTPHRGSGDKLARLNSVADIVASGLVWVPETRWAEEVVEEIAGFPFMSNDDLVDSSVMALMRFRQGGFIRLPSDEPETQRYFKQRGRGYY